jgi:hypothetical protein
VTLQAAQRLFGHVLTHADRTTVSQRNHNGANPKENQCLVTAKREYRLNRPLVQAHSVTKVSKSRELYHFIGDENFAIQTQSRMAKTRIVRILHNTSLLTGSLQQWKDINLMLKRGLIYLVLRVAEADVKSTTERRYLKA